MYSRMIGGRDRKSVQADKQAYEVLLIWIN